MRYLGLGKTIFNSNVTLLAQNPDGSLDLETVLTERILKVKNAGNWPSRSLQILLENPFGDFSAGESRDVSSSEEYEEALDRSFPFYQFLQQQKLSEFSRKFNKKIRSFGHHRAHAFGALAFSPFEESLIVVIDGAGSNADFLRQNRQDLEAIHGDIPNNAFECASVYEMKNGKLHCLKKEFLEFKKGRLSGRSFSSGIGLFYETISEFIFNNKNEAGKVMGLAPFGTRMPVENLEEFLDSLDWSKKFSEKGKKIWEESPHLSLYKDLAATAQYVFEVYLENFLTELKKEHPTHENIVFTGGCALNCTANWKMAAKNIFSAIHVLPFPGDESIALGCAYGLSDFPHKPFPVETQTSFYGPKSSVPSTEQIFSAFAHYKCSVEKNIAQKVAKEIAEGKIVAWFQGRSECGPRALGHRSILARPDRHDLKNYLNDNIKFRETFRPYGSTVIWEKAHEYFNIPVGFENPFMSFAVPVNEKWKEKLKHVTHVDGTSRMQTLHQKQEPLYYQLLLEVEKLTGMPVVLNTSLNIMGEPILETIEDAERFFQSSLVDGICIGNVWIQK